MHACSWSAARQHVRWWTSMICTCVHTVLVKPSLSTTPWSMLPGRASVKLKCTVIAISERIVLILEYIIIGIIYSIHHSCHIARRWAWSLLFWLVNSNMVMKVEEWLHACITKLLDYMYWLGSSSRSSAGLRAIPNAVCCEDHFQW